MAKVVGVKFKNSSKIYYFAPTEESYDEYSGVIVETAKGPEYGTVMFGVREVSDKECVLPLKPIVRKATKRDIETVRKNEARVAESLKIAEEKVKNRNLKMKLVGCEFSFDGKKVVFYFTAEGRVDFRELVKDLASAFHIRIELRQVGIRDETKLIGGLAPCGRPCCCGSCMPDFRKVSIKMAKTQGLSLNPTKISGLCGRLMCCLEYENEYYGEAYKKMPKLGGKVSTPEGEGIVVSNNMLKLVSKVKIAKNDGSEVYKDFAVDELKFKRGGNAPDDDREMAAIAAQMKEILD
ncbi:MAG: stage 0 sporulation protein [Bacillota bacterium]|nr:MAG: stage 0 sporulation protein [Bacillota bacterium]